MTDTPKIVLRKTRKGNGYTIMKKDSFIPTEHFQSLLNTKIMTGFKAKDKDTNEIRKDSNGKDIWVNYVSNEHFGELEEYCNTHSMLLETLDALPERT